MSAPTFEGPADPFELHPAARVREVTPLINPEVRDLYQAVRDAWRANDCIGGDKLVLQTVTDAWGVHLVSIERSAEELPNVNRHNSLLTTAVRGIKRLLGKTDNVDPDTDSAMLPCYIVRVARSTGGQPQDSTIPVAVVYPPGADVRNRYAETAFVAEERYRAPADLLLPSASSESDGLDIAEVSLTGAPALAVVVRMTGLVRDGMFPQIVRSQSQDRAA